MNTQDATVLFEQPLNEHIRVCLRLEQIFQKISDNLGSRTVWECRSALEGILEALNVMDRPDIKNKLTKTLSDQSRALMLLEQKPGIDKEKLQAIITELNQLIEYWCRNQDKIGHQLRANTFLTTIRQHLLNPGGPCQFNTPSYHLWLHLPVEHRRRELEHWFAELSHLQTAVKLLLQLTRSSANTMTFQAPQGFYQQAMDPNISFQLIRIWVDLNEHVYPEISVGKHRLSVRFYQLDTFGRPTQTPHDISFQMAFCVF